mmetsp:Transcript_17297/g.33658  ORF Transcript_17297/g.33658 Transcript_17297/m.33658 type:complete len:261 (-) Transcript_17297:747-1529(-)
MPRSSALSLMSPIYETSGEVHIPIGKRSGSDRYDFGSNLRASSCSASPSYTSPNIAFTAAVPCSIPVLASPGGPNTSPAAYTPLALVSRFSSTITRPRSSTWIPACSSPISPVFGIRPAANKYMSASRVSPVGFFFELDLSSIPIGLHKAGGTLNCPTTVSNLSSTPDSTKSSLSASAISGSTPTLPMALGKLVSRMIMVTCAPSPAKIFAYSILMIPAPVIATELGRYERSLIESESKTLLPSNGIPFRRKADDPVARR